MNLEFMKPLLESGLINEDVSKSINEAWENKLNEAKDQVRAELREEFAQKYEHDRTVMVEALDKMVTDSLQSEIEEFYEEKKAINEDRVQAKRKLVENASKFNNFMITKLAEEIRELRNDRKIQMENQKKLEQFVVHALAREIKEFSQDKKDVVEAKVKLVAEGRRQLEKLKAKFINESAKKLSKSVAKHLKGEISQLKEDIVSARENNFGRKLFEAFASEYSVTYLNDKAETRKLLSKIKQTEEKLAEATNKAARASKLVESKDREVRIIKETIEREKVMESLLSTLNNDKAKIMRGLLENVQTARLKTSFEKYLPAVINNGSGKTTNKTVITEQVVEVTGNKSAKTIKEVDVEDQPVDNVIDIKRLAGL